MSTEGENAELAEPSVADVDRIRDIIFGSQMRQYDQHFKRMASQVDLMGKQVEELRATLDQEQSGRQERTNDLQREVRQLQGELRKALDELRSDLSSRVEQQGANTQGQLRQLTTDVRQQSQELRNEFAASLKDLEAETTNRHNLGDLLIEMGMRLKQEGGITELLEQLEQAAEAPPEE